MQTMGNRYDIPMSVRDGVSPAVSRMTERTIVFRRTLRDLNRQGNRTWSDMRGLSSYMQLGFVAAVGAGVKAGVDFQDQMSQVATLLDGNVNQKIGDMSTQVLQLAKDTGTSTSLITSGLYQTVSAFGDTKDAMNILQTATKAATAGNSTVTDSVNLLSAVMKGYGNVSAQSAKQVSDMAFLTVKLGQTTFPELAQNMGKVIPLASALGVKMKDVFAAESTLTGVTGDTAAVSTGLQATFKALISPTTAMQQVYTKLGISSGQALIKQKGFKGALDLLVKSTHGNTAQLSKMFGQVEALNQVLALTGAQSDNFTQKQKEMANSGGAMAQAYSRATDTIAHKWKVLVQTVNTTFIKGDTNSGIMKDVGNLLDMLTKTVNFTVSHWTQISPIIYGVAGAFIVYKGAALASAAATALLGDRAAIAALKTEIMGTVSLVASGQVGILSGSVRILNSVFRANPIGTVVTIIGVLITGFIYAKRHVQELRLEFMKTWNHIVAVAQWGVNKYLDYANFMLRGYKFVFDGIKYAGISIWDGIVKGAQTGINKVLKMISPVSGLLKHVGINIPASVNFSGAQIKATAPKWDKSIGIPHVSFAKGHFTYQQMQAQETMAYAEKQKNQGSLHKQMGDLIKALDKNTGSTDKNSGSTDKNTGATNGNTSTLKKGVSVDMSGEQIAGKLLPRLERHLYGT